MHRAGLVALIVFGTVLGASAQSYPVAKKRKVSANHNSYTLHNYGQRPAAQPRAQAPRTYSEIDVAPAPTLQAAGAPALEAAPAPSSYPVPMAVAGETYSQAHNPGPSQLPANRQGTSSQSIYSLGPNWGPGFYNGGGFYNNFNNGYYNGYSNGAFSNGFYNRGYYNTGFRNRGFCAPNAGFNYGPGFQSNLVPQRFDPLPGQHPFSIQRPQMFPQQLQTGGGFYNRCR
jgi:hypothetical protein